MTDDTEETPPENGFAELGIEAPLLGALTAMDHHHPTTIQQRTIPPLLQGKDLVGQAQTGTGKTAAFALPLLARLDIAQRDPQVLVLAPTRELAIQVSQAFKSLASGMRGFKVLTIYGGQSYTPQLRALDRGVHVVVGTPGRVIDHLGRGTLRLDGLKALVLDEADEMLQMGFIDDVELILKQAPAERQMALFSATMPAAIRRIASRHLDHPVEVLIKSRPTGAETIRQRQLMVKKQDKLDALGRILEVEPYDGALVFVRTKVATVEVAEALEARGFSVAALNGDMPQSLRERTVERLRKGHLGVLVATDVAARGLDVERISHVINFDAPQNAEAYVHRIGRTGRAGRRGETILLLQPNQRRLVQIIERATRQRIERMPLPTTAAINKRRVAQFLDRITNALDAKDLPFYRGLIEQYLAERETSPIDAAAALAMLLQGAQPLLLRDPPRRKKPKFEPREDRRPTRDRASASRGAVEGRAAPGAKTAAGARTSGGAKAAAGTGAPAGARTVVTARRPEDGPATRSAEAQEKRPAASGGAASAGMERFRIEVGHSHGVKPGNIFGAIANESGLDSEFIGRIDIHEEHSTIELPEGMPRGMLQALKRVWICQRQLKIIRLPTPGMRSAKPTGKKAKPGGKKAKPGGKKARPGGKKAKPGGKRSKP